MLFPFFQMNLQSIEFIEKMVEASLENQNAKAGFGKRIESYQSVVTGPHNNCIVFIYASL